MAKILVVDDRAPDRLYLVTLLGYAGHSVLEAADGNEALCVLKAERPDLIVTDLLLPGIDGFELMRQVRAEGNFADTPLIVYSATYQNDEARSLAQTCGVSCFLTKPTEPEVILRTVAQVLGGAPQSHAPPEAFDRDHARLVNEKLYQRDAALEAARRLTALMQMGQLLTLERDIPSLLQRVCEIACDVVDASVAVTGLVESDQLRLAVFAIADHGSHRTLQEWTPPNPRAGVLGRLLDQGRPCRLRHLESTHEDGTFLPAGQSAKSFLGVPVSTPSRVLGWLYLLNKKGDEEFSDSDEQVATVLAAQAGIACENSLRNEEIKQQSAQLHEQARRKDEFLAMLGHELRNPLAAIVNAHYLLMLKHAGDEDTVRIGELMNRQLGNLVHLIDDLLDVARITSGKIDLQKQPLDLSTAISRAVESTRSVLTSRQQTLEVRMPTEAVQVDADPARFEQTVVNLLINAAKYSEPGGKIQLAAGADANGAFVRIRDQGIGIRPEHLKEIFSLFRQADRVHGRVFEGLGVGLALVRKLIELHGGTVDAFSEGPGCGSEFVLRLPAQAIVNVSVTPSSVTNLSSTSLRVLVTDDNVDAAESTAMLMRRNGGHDVRTAYDGASALSEARGFRPQVVFLDIGLPNGMDGYEVARRLRQEAGGDRVILIAMTGFGQPDDIARAVAAGFDHHLVKPGDPVAIRNILGSLNLNEMSMSGES